MKQSNQFFLSLFLLHIFTQGLPAQTTKQEVEYNNHSMEILDLGKNGFALIGSSDSQGDKKDATVWVTRLDKNGDFRWGKSVTTNPKEKYTNDFYASSADGSDVYILSFDDFKMKGGYYNLTLTHLDTAGTEMQKVFPYPNFGFVMTMYANSKYLFVITQQQSYTDCRVDCKMKLCRFDKTTLEMTELSPDYADADPKIENPWNMIRITDDFVEGYRNIAVDDHSVTLELARFDNDGKRSGTKNATITLKKGFTDCSNSNQTLPPGITRRYYNLKPYELPPGEATANYGYTVGDPQSRCYVLYDDVNNCYIAYGLTGDSKMPRMYPSAEGYFVQSLDGDFKPGILKEYDDASQITSDKHFVGTETQYSRYIDAFLTTDGNLIVSIEGGWTKHHNFILDEKTLIQKKYFEGNMEGMKVYGIYCAEPDANLTQQNLYSKDDASYANYTMGTKSGQLYVVGNADANKVTTYWSGEMGGK